MNKLFKIESTADDSFISLITSTEGGRFFSACFNGVESSVKLNIIEAYFVKRLMEKLNKEFSKK